MLLSWVTTGADCAGDASADAGAFRFLLDRFRTGTSLTALALFLVLDSLPVLAPLVAPEHQLLFQYGHCHVGGVATCKHSTQMLGI